MFFFYFASLVIGKVPIMTEAEILEKVKTMPKLSGYVALYVKEKFDNLPKLFYCFRQLMLSINTIVAKDPIYCVVIDSTAEEPLIKQFVSGFHTLKPISFPIYYITEEYGSEGYGVQDYLGHARRAALDFYNIKRRIQDLSTAEKGKATDLQMKNALTEKSHLINQTIKMQRLQFETRKKQRQLLKEFLTEYGTLQMKNKFKYVMDEEL